MSRRPWWSGRPWWSAAILAAPVGRDRPRRRGAEAGADEGNAISVKTVRPRHDPSFNTSVEQPAFVEGYYQADLMARVAGPIKPGGIVDAIGDRVKAGDVLVQIDVPDLEQDVLQKEAVVTQRQSELDLARANVKTADAAVKAAGWMIKVKESDVDRAVASRNFREKELHRFTNLAKGPNPAVTEDIVDERTEYYEAAVANVATAQAAVKDAQAELEKAQAKSEAADADVKVAESLVGVARKDRDNAQAWLDFATIRAPFDGVITRRKVDPGTFVQNATTAHTEPLLTVVRDDIVTVYMKVPDKFAAYVNPDTEAIIQMDLLPGLVIHGKVTRYSSSLDNPEHDRTMRVEVDLYNGSAEEYQAFLAQGEGHRQRRPEEQDPAGVPQGRWQGRGRPAAAPDPRAVRQDAAGAAQLPGSLPAAPHARSSARAAPRTCSWSRTVRL